MTGLDAAGPVHRPGRWDVAATLFLAVLFAVLAVRATAEDRWSDWSFGDALTLLSLRQWDENGWIANRLLMLPQGYAAPIRHLDDPELRPHAHGISLGSSPRVGPRLWYTHYPAGYLVPQALLTRLGLGSMAALRLLALSFSVAALALMYVVFSRLAGPPAAFAATVVYALSPAFLGYADSLANQPLDDLLRFGFMLAVVLSTRAATPRARRGALLAAWGVEFALSLSSYDSVFFLYLWLVGWDVLETRRAHWRAWLVFAAAPVSAFGLCFLQNVWYLGWTDAARDIADAFLMKSAGPSVAPVSGRAGLDASLHGVVVVARGAFGEAWLLPALAALYAVRRRVLADPHRAEAPGPGVLALLFLCGAAFVVVLPKATWMAYEARQLAPFAALLAGGLTVAVAGDIAALRRATPGRRPQAGRRAAVLVVAAATILGVFWVDWAGRLWELSQRPSLFAIPRDHPSLAAAKGLRSFTPEHDAIFFDLEGFGAYVTSDVSDYPHIHPMIEYYLGRRLVLAFSSEQLAARDLELLARRAPRQFSPVLVSGKLEGLAGIVAILDGRGLLRRVPDRPFRIGQAYVLDLTPAMNW